ncbi:putative uncharacterized protein [Clostridium sp. CAG:448]|nr:putative uncharacterized protein [Clostridium sp. CAG:448]
MEYRRFGDTILARIDKGEEILTQLRLIAETEHIRLAHVSALGATNDFTVGALNTDAKAYVSNRFRGDYEIVSLTGTITTMNGAYYSHIHMSAGNETGTVSGGHLNSATVSATCEMVIRIIDGTVNRKYDPDTGLNLFDFSE